MDTSLPTSNPFQAARELLKTLQQEFPVFRDHAPLAIGIDRQIAAKLPGVDRKTLRAALGIHTNSWRYLKVLSKATVRLDLEGKPAGEIREEHRERAVSILRERYKKDAEQRKKQQQEEEAARRRAEKLHQLAEKFSRHAR